MTKTILITGSTDGIGLEAAKVLYSQGHHILLHGRSDKKLKAAEKALSELSGDGLSKVTWLICRAWPRWRRSAKRLSRTMNNSML